MRDSSLLLSFSLALITPATILAQRDRPSVDGAITAGANLLIASQENYVPDAPVPPMPDEKVPGWQESERERLAKIRAESGSKAEWPYQGVYRIAPDGRIPPGYRVGGTAIVCNALCIDSKYSQNEAARQSVEHAIGFMLDELESNEKLAPGPKEGYDVRGWAHTYALDFLLFAKRHDLLPEKYTERVEKMIPHLLECLAANEVKGQGGWNYAGNSLSPFMTGSTLLALYQAREMGYEFDHGMVERALDGLDAARTKTGSFIYSGTANGPVAMPGACARAAIAELCLFLAGRSDEMRLRNAVYAFFAHYEDLLVRKSQQGTHVAPYGVAPYYFMYAHTYAALAIEYLPRVDRQALRKKMQETLWSTREADGGWNDRIFPRSKSYSTAMAMLALGAPRLDRIPEWKSVSAAAAPEGK
ncbi:MAG: terpene cyclase/mutase family protein [Planctomycetes bacterium]|nr:terpene cyclase/mutase family protein [Planctomycetota bacterium]